jgi:hypothetical protein
MDEATFNYLEDGVLSVRLPEFKTWLATERRKGKWLSQRPGLGPRRKKRGRPRIAEVWLRNEVRDVIDAGRWHARFGIRALEKI